MRTKPLTLLYATSGEALIQAWRQPADVQAEPYLQTSSDVVGYLDSSATERRLTAAWGFR